MAVTSVDIWNFVLTKLIPALAIGYVTYYIYNYIFIRPRMNRMQQQEMLIKSLVVGDEVITVGGIIGKISQLDEDTAYLDVGNDIILRVMKPGIGQRFDKYESNPESVDEWIDDEDSTEVK